MSNYLIYQHFFTFTYSNIQLTNNPHSTYFSVQIRIPSINHQIAPYFILNLPLSLHPQTKNPLKNKGFSLLQLIHHYNIPNYIFLDHILISYFTHIYKLSLYIPTALVGFICKLYFQYHYLEILTELF